MFDSWICGKCGRRWKFSEPVSFERLHQATAKLKNSGQCSPECAAIRPPKPSEYVYFPPEKWTYPVLAMMPSRKNQRRRLTAAAMSATSAVLFAHSGDLVFSLAMLFFSSWFYLRHWRFKNLRVMDDDGVMPEEAENG